MLPLGRCQQDGADARPTKLRAATNQPENPASGCAAGLIWSRQPRILVWHGGQVVSERHAVKHWFEQSGFQGVRVEGKLPRIRDVLGTGQNVSDISGQPAYPALKVSAPQPLVMWAVVVDSRQVAPGQVRMPSSVRHLFGSKRWSTCSPDSTSPGLLAMAAVDGHVSASDISVPARADVLLHGGMPSGRKY